MDTVTVLKAFLNLEAKIIDAIALMLTLNSSPENVTKATAMLKDCADDLRKLAKGE